MTKNTYLAILKTGIYLSLLSVFLVYNKFLFPYITSKQIYFNILIETLLVFWVVFVLKYPEYRPKKNWISTGLISFFVVMFLASFTSVDFNLSFWGDIERMLGFFHIFHFLGFYFILISIMRDWRDWKIFFILSVICAVFVSFYTLNKVNFSTIGNTAYVSGYLIFNIYFALILFFHSIKKTEFKFGRDWFLNLAPSLVYLIPLPIMLSAFKVADTSGAHVGLGISLFSLLFLLGIFAKNKKIKTYILSSVLILVLVVGFLFLNRNSEFLKGTYVAHTFKQLTAEKNTFQTRLISWRAAAKDLKNHPILGTGYGNYAITFDKYFDPSFYDHSRSETYFDRAHNNLIGILSTMGILGLLTYLSIFAALAYYLIRGFRKDKISLYEFALISSLVIAYFVQNLAVFDSLVTYMGLMIVLGFSYYKVNDIEQEENISYKDGKEIYIIPLSFWAIIHLYETILTKYFSNSSLIIHLISFILLAALLSFIYYKVTNGEKNDDNKKLENNSLSIVVVIGLVMLFIIYQYNIKPVKMLKGTIGGQIAFAKGDINGGIDAYKQALSYDTGLDRDSRSSLVRLILSRQNLLHALDKKEAKEILDYVISLAKVNTEYNPQDSLMQMQLSQILSIAINFASDNNEKLDYVQQAQKAIDAAILSSPGRIRLYYTKAQIHLMLGDLDNAINVLTKAASLNEKYYDSYCHLARIQVGSGDAKNGYAAADKCVDLGGAKLLTQANFVKQLINRYSTATTSPEQNIQRLISLFERLSQMETKNAQVLVNLAQLYAKVDNNDKAIQTAKKAATIDSSLKSSVDGFIGNLRTGVQ